MYSIFKQTISKLLNASSTATACICSQFSFINKIAATLPCREEFLSLRKMV